MILYVGDIHGSTYAARKIDELATKIGVEAIVQVGDFGLLWTDRGAYDETFLSYFYCREPSLPPWYTCGGNHDNWAVWNELAKEQEDSDIVKLVDNCFWVQRSRVISLGGKKHLFFGGAESIDKHHRTEGVSWWREETPTFQEFQDFFEAIESEKPDVIVAHDAPRFIEIYRVDNRNSVTPNTLQQIFDSIQHKPQTYFFGHHHILQDWNVNGTHFLCCGIEGEGWIGDSDLKTFEKFQLE